MNASNMPGLRVFVYPGLKSVVHISAQKSKPTIDRVRRSFFALRDARESYNYIAIHPKRVQQRILSPFAAGSIHMPLNTLDFPAAPECGGKQWSVLNEDQLATLVAIVLIGRAKHAESVLAGSQQNFAVVPDAIKQQLRVQLHPISEALTYHRDGLLFEIISWIAARITAAADEVISTPHLKSTQQGLDTIKIGFDPITRTLTRVVIHEQKCTERPRDQFRENVLQAFHDWKAHKRDNELVQAVTGLVERFNLSDEEHLRLYDRLVQVHPLVFQAALTVVPSPFDTARCVSLFDGYSKVTPNVQDRLGDTFPLANVRGWFAAFAQHVWQKIEGSHV